MLPNFLIIGAMKSGTTTLYHLLKSHPEIYMCEIKEPRFFSLEKNMAGISRYESLFRDAKGKKAIGEASTNYTKYPIFKDVPQRIKRYIPDARLIYIVRNPVERAYSEFTYNYATRGVEKNNFHQAITENPSYINISKYYMQIEQYLNVFEREQIEVVLLEDLRDSPHEVIRDIYGFLEVDREYTPPRLGEHTHQTKNRAGQNRAIKNRLRKIPGYRSISNVISDDAKGVLNRVLRKKVEPPQKITLEEKRYLIDHLENDILAFQECIGRDLSMWLQ
jgi:hypothetical protein